MQDEFRAGAEEVEVITEEVGPEIEYRVTATIADAELVHEYLRWLIEGHLEAVIAGGAYQASLLQRVDAEPAEIESVYRFATEEDFTTYEREFAPALRAEGLARFGEAGISFSRRVSLCLATLEIDEDDEDDEDDAL